MPPPDQPPQPDRETTATPIPDWYPAWAKELAELYFAGSTSFFILHGNVHDFVHSPRGTRGAFCSLTEFLAEQVFGQWDMVLSYDLGRGLRAEAGPDAARLQQMLKTAATHLGNSAAWPRDADAALAAVDGLINRVLLAEKPEDRQRLALLFPHAQYLAPAEVPGTAGRDAARLVRLLSWAQNPYIKRVNVAICLIAERLSEVNQRLVQNPHVAAIEIPLPDAPLRQTYLASQLGAEAKAPEGLTVAGLAQLSGGLNLVNLSVALSRSGDNGRCLDVPRFRQLKKGMIERQCRDLVTFVEPSHNLDMVVGHEAAKQRLRLDAKWIGEGLLDAAPMGYLVCGPVGTGKTFLAECYAGAIGIPCLVLRNFRSKFVGETEGNLQQVLTVLRSLGPVVVIVDEADAALGNRSMEGDSGTSNRVFSMIASQMGDTRYRGRIVWMLLTSRPDMLPIDLKRQGRAEVHIPLFYPQQKAEISEMLSVMAAKNKIRLGEAALPEIDPQRQLSGADLESIILGARRRALAAGRQTVDRGDVDASLASFIPSAQGLEKEIQELVAVIECTDREFLTAPWRDAIDQPDGRLKLQQRLAAMRAMVE
ncbi:MAG: ATP-binding protein [Pirellulales bacterium]|nr:ATP-binding protein [Pirellulales bacterium]